MKIEFVLNKIDNEWWFDLGLSYQNVMHPQYKKVLTISLIFASIYIRWQKKNNKKVDTH